MKEGDLIPNITLRSIVSDGVENFNLIEIIIFSEFDLNSNFYIHLVY